ncbi:MAG: helix-turn-helix domain-containing protein [Desulfovibrio sp.]
MSAETTAYHEQLRRIHRVFGTRTQVELAGVLGIAQSSVADASRRRRIPVRWLMAALLKRDINPDWILTGTAPKYRPSANLPGPMDREALQRMHVEDLLTALARLVPGLEVRFSTLEGDGEELETGE